MPRQVCNCKPRVFSLGAGGRQFKNEEIKQPHNSIEFHGIPHYSIRTVQFNRFGIDPTLSPHYSHNLSHSLSSPCLNITMAPFSHSNLALLLLQMYFLLMNFTVERSYCADEFTTNPTDFFIPETVAFCKMNNRLFLERPEWMVSATCIHSYIFPIG